MVFPLPPAPPPVSRLHSLPLVFLLFRFFLIDSPRSLLETKATSGTSTGAVGGFRNNRGCCRAAATHETGRLRVTKGWRFFMEEWQVRPLPEEFRRRMDRLLGEEAEREFLEARVRSPAAGIAGQYPEGWNRPLPGAVPSWRWSRSPSPPRASPCRPSSGGGGSSAPRGRLLYAEPSAMSAVTALAPGRESGCWISAPRQENPPRSRPAWRAGGCCGATNMSVATPPPCSRTWNGAA